MGFKSVKRKLAWVMSLVMLVTAIPFSSFADEYVPQDGTEYLAAQEINPELISDGMFYFGTDAADFNEAEAGSYLLKVGRFGSSEDEADVRIKFVDYSTKYGTDYKVRPLNDSGRVMNVKESQSLLEYMEGEQQKEYNYSDAVIDGTVTSLNQIKDGDEATLTEEEMAAMNAQAEAAFDALLGQAGTATPSVADKPGSSEQGTQEDTKSPVAPQNMNPGNNEEIQEKKATKSDADQLSLSELWELSSGLSDDKAPLDYTDTSFLTDSELSADNPASLSQSVDEIATALKSAYLDLHFAKNETEKYIKITILDNYEAVGERNGQFVLCSLNDSMVAATYQKFVMTIQDDEDVPEPNIYFESTELYPENGYVTVNVLRDNNTASLCTAMIDTYDGSAEGGTEYSQVHAELFFAPGVTKRTIKIPVRTLFLEEEKDFTIRLQEPKGCSIASDTATVTMTPSDDTFENDILYADETSVYSLRSLMAEDDGEEEDEAVLFGAAASGATLRGIDSVITGKPLELAELNNYNAISGKNSYSYAVGKNGWALYLKDGGHDVRGSIEFRFSKDTYALYDYSGLRIEWSNTSGKPTYGTTRLYYKSHVNYLQQVFEEGNDKRWDSTDDLYFVHEKTSGFRIGMTRNGGWAGTSPLLTIKSVKPIMRPFEVSLKSAEPVKFIDPQTGLYKDNTQIKGKEKYNSVRLDNANAGKTVVTSGSAITMVLDSAAQNDVYIKGVMIVCDGKKSYVLNDLPVGTNTAKIDINTEFLNKYGDYEYIKFISNGEKGKYGRIQFQPVLAAMPAEVTVTRDERVNIKLWDGQGGVQTPASTASGIDTYTNFNVGDAIRYTVEFKEGYGSVYRCEQLDLDVTKPSGIKGHYIKKDEGKDYLTEVLEYSGINIKPVIESNKNRVLVRVKTSDLSYFDTSMGIFTYPSSVDGAYTEYVIEESDVISGKHYELEAFCKDDTKVPTWQQSFADKVKFSQETFYHVGETEPDKNVIVLSADTAAATPFAIRENIKYEEAILGGKSVGTAWLNADGAAIILGRRQYGITDYDGNCTTMPFKSVAGNSIRYKIVANGSVTYGTTRLSTEKTEEITGIGGEMTTVYMNDLGNTTVGVNSDSRPHVDTVYVENTPSEIGVALIDKNSRTSFRISVTEKDPITGDNYKYTYTDASGVERTAEEKVTDVELIVIDPVTKEKKLVFGSDKIKRSLTEEGIWELTTNFRPGNYAQYQAGDIIYVRLITDRKNADGSIAAINTTAYAPVNTNIYFKEKAPEPSVPLTLNAYDYHPQNFCDLPYIGILTSIITIKYLYLSSEPTPIGWRIYAGFQYTFPSASFDHVGESTGNNLLFDDEKKSYGDQFDQMIERITEEGEKNKVGAMALGLPVWTFTPCVGIYFEFAAYKDGFTGDTKFLFIGGGGFLGATGSFRYTYYMIITGIPFYAGGTAALNVLFELGAAVGEVDYQLPDEMNQADFKGMIDNSSFQFVFRTALTATLYAGVGVYGVVGFRGGFVLKMQIIVNPTVKKVYPDIDKIFGFKVTGSIKFWIDALLTTITLPVYDFDPWYKSGYFKEIDKYKAAKNSRSGDGDAIQGAGTLSMMAKPSDNLASGAFNTASRPAGDATYEIASTRSLQRDGYDDTDIQLMAFKSGGKEYALMVCLDELTDGVHAMNRTRLKYSVYDAETESWSTLKQVSVPNEAGSDTADFSPSLCDAGDRILITWTSRKNADIDYSDYEEHLKSLDINAAWFNKDTKDISGVTAIASDNYYNRMPAAVYDEATGDACVLFYKSEVTDIETAEHYLKNVNTEQNNSYLAYILYDGATGKWMTNELYATEYADADDTTRQRLLTSLKGQRLLASPVSDVANNPVIADVVQGTINVKTYGSISDVLTPEEADSLEKSGTIDRSKTVSVATASNAIAVYTIDRDQNSNTVADKELYVQRYDFATHRYSEPVRLTNDTVSQSAPQIVTAGENSYLFWLEDAGAANGTSHNVLRYVHAEDVYRVLEDSEHTPIEPEDVKTADIRMTGSDEYAVFDSYLAFADRYNNLYVAFPQGETGVEASGTGGTVLTFKQDIYMSALKLDGSLDAEGCVIGSDWSDAVRISNSGEREGKVNNTPVLADVGRDTLLMLNNSYFFTDKGYDDDGNAVYEISNNDLLETVLTAAGSVEISDADIDINWEEPVNDTDVKVTVTAELENTGLIISRNVNGIIRLKNGNKTVAEANFHQGSGVDIAAGADDFVTVSFNVPKSIMEYPENLKLEVVAKETTNGGDIVAKISSMKLFENKGFKDSAILKKTEFRNISSKHYGETMSVRADVYNAGNVVIEKGSVVKIYSGSDEKKSFGSVTIDTDIMPGDSVVIEKTFETPAELDSFASQSIGLEVFDKVGNTISLVKNEWCYIESPYDIKVNGLEDGGTLKVKKGKTLDLTAAYSPDYYYVNAPAIYSSEDGHIADVVNGKLTGLNVGETVIDVSINPYGGKASFKVVVEAADPVVDPDDDDDDVVTKKTVISGPADSVPLNGSWQQNANGTWMFFNGDGTLKTGWGHTETGDNKTYYHFNEKGVMETGWILVDGDWYYMSEIKDSSEGAMQRNWHLDSQDGRWYYLDPVTGKMLTGWQKINGKWYFLSPAILAPTWMKDLDDKYHYIGGGRPYGSMYVNEYTPDGYRVGPDGAWIP